MSEIPKKGVRGYFLTLNNWTQEEYDQIKSWDNTTWLVIAKEVGKECGTPHLHIIVWFKNCKTFSAVKKLNPRMNIQVLLAAEAAKKYLEKEDKEPFESGKMPSQGQRKDLEELQEEMKSGKRTLQQIRDENARDFHMYGRTLEKLEDDYNRKKRRTEMTEGLWYWGKTATGKSETAYSIPEEYYDYTEDGGWWDGYNGEHTVIIDDFRGQIPYNMILRLVDKHPFKVRRRGREPFPFTSKRVIITSSMPPEDVYHNLAERDSLDQLRRRFKIIEFKKLDGATGPSTEVPRG